MASILNLLQSTLSSNTSLGNDDTTTRRVDEAGDYAARSHQLSTSPFGEAAAYAHRSAEMMGIKPFGASGPMGDVGEDSMQYVAEDSFDDAGEIRYLNVFGRKLSKTELEKTEVGRNLMELAKLERKGPAGFIEGFTRRGWIQFVPFLNDISAIGMTVKETKQTYDTFKKMNEGEEISNEEAIRARLFLATGERENRQTGWGTAGSIIAGSIGFGLEFALLQGGAAAWRASRQATKLAAVEGGKRAILDQTKDFTFNGSRKLMNWVFRTKTDDMAVAGARMAVRKEGAAIGLKGAEGVIAASKQLDTPLAKGIASTLDDIVAKTVISAEAQSGKVLSKGAREALEKNTREYAARGIAAELRMLDKNWALRSADATRRAFSTNLLRAFDPMEEVGEGIREGLHRAGHYMARASVLGMGQLGVDEAVEALAAPLFGVDRVINPTELSLFSSGVLQQNQDIVNNARLISLGMKWVEYMSERSGEALSSIGEGFVRSVSKTALGGAIAESSIGRVGSKVKQFMSLSSHDVRAGAAMKEQIIKGIPGVDIKNLSTKSIRDIAAQAVYVEGQRAALESGAAMLTGAALEEAIKAKEKEVLKAMLVPTYAKMLTRFVMKTGIGPQEFTRYLKMVGHDGVLEEIGEEVVGGFVHGLMGNDDMPSRSIGARLRHAVDEAFIDKEELWPMVFAFAMPSIGKHALHQAQTALLVGPQGSIRNAALIDDRNRAMRGCFVCDKTVVGVDGEEIHLSSPTIITDHSVASEDSGVARTEEFLKLSGRKAPGPQNVVAAIMTSPRNGRGVFAEAGKQMDYVNRGVISPWRRAVAAGANLISAVVNGHMPFFMTPMQAMANRYDPALGKTLQVMGVAHNALYQAYKAKEAEKGNTPTHAEIEAAIENDYLDKVDEIYADHLAARGVMYMSSESRDRIVRERLDMSKATAAEIAAARQEVEDEAAAIAEGRLHTFTEEERLAGGQKLLDAEDARKAQVLSGLKARASQARENLETLKERREKAKERFKHKKGAVEARMKPLIDEATQTLTAIEADVTEAQKLVDAAAIQANPAESARRYREAKGRATESNEKIASLELQISELVAEKTKRGDGADSKELDEQISSLQAEQSALRDTVNASEQVMEQLADFADIEDDSEKIVDPRLESYAQQYETIRREWAKSASLMYHRGSGEMVYMFAMGRGAHEDDSPTRKAVYQHFARARVPVALRIDRTGSGFGLLYEDVNAQNLSDISKVAAEADGSVATVDSFKLADYFGLPVDLNPQKRSDEARKIARRVEAGVATLNAGMVFEGSDGSTLTLRKVLQKYRFETTAAGQKLSEKLKGEFDSVDTAAAALNDAGIGSWRQRDVKIKLVPSMTYYSDAPMDMVLLLTENGYQTEGLQGKGMGHFSVDMGPALTTYQRALAEHRAKGTKATFANLKGARSELYARYAMFEKGYKVATNPEKTTEQDKTLLLGSQLANEWEEATGNAAGSLQSDTALQEAFFRSLADRKINHDNELDKMLSDMGHHKAMDAFVGRAVYAVTPGAFNDGPNLALTFAGLREGAALVEDFGEVIMSPRQNLAYYLNREEMRAEISPTVLHFFNEVVGLIDRRMQDMEAKNKGDDYLYRAYKQVRNFYVNPGVFNVEAYSKMLSAVLLRNRGVGVTGYAAFADMADEIRTLSSYAPFVVLLSEMMGGRVAVERVVDAWAPTSDDARKAREDISLAYTTVEETYAKADPLLAAQYKDMYQSWDIAAAILARDRAREKATTHEQRDTTTTQEERDRADGVLHTRASEEKEELNKPDLDIDTTGVEGTLSDNDIEIINNQITNLDLFIKTSEEALVTARAHYDEGVADGTAELFLKSRKEAVDDLVAELEAAAAKRQELQDQLDSNGPHVEQSARNAGRASGINKNSIIDVAVNEAQSRALLAASCELASIAHSLRIKTYGLGDEELEALADLGVKMKAGFTMTPGAMKDYVRLGLVVLSRFSPNVLSTSTAGGINIAERMATTIINARNRSGNLVPLLYDFGVSAGDVGAQTKELTIERAKAHVFFLNLVSLFTPTHHLHDASGDVIDATRREAAAFQQQYADDERHSVAATRLMQALSRTQADPGKNSPERNEKSYDDLTKALTTLANERNYPRLFALGVALKVMGYEQGRTLIPYLRSQVPAAIVSLESLKVSSSEEAVGRLVGVRVGAATPMPSVGVADSGRDISQAMADVTLSPGGYETYVSLYDKAMDALHYVLFQKSYDETKVLGVVDLRGKATSDVTASKPLRTALAGVYDVLYNTKHNPISELLRRDRDFRRLGTRRSGLVNVDANIGASTAHDTLVNLALAASRIGTSLHNTGAGSLAEGMTSFKAEFGGKRNAVQKAILRADVIQQFSNLVSAKLNETSPTDDNRGGGAFANALRAIAMLGTPTQKVNSDGSTTAGKMQGAPGILDSTVLFYSSEQGRALLADPTVSSDSPVEVQEAEKRRVDGIIVGMARDGRFEDGTPMLSNIASITVSTKVPNKDGYEATYASQSTGKQLAHDIIAATEMTLQDILVNAKNAPDYLVMPLYFGGHKKLAANVPASWIKSVKEAHLQKINKETGELNTSFDMIDLYRAYIDQMAPALNVDPKRQILGLSTHQARHPATPTRVAVITSLDAFGDASHPEGLNGAAITNLVGMFKDHITDAHRLLIKAIEMYAGDMTSERVKRLQAYADMLGSKGKADGEAESLVIVADLSAAKINPFIGNNAPKVKVKVGEGHTFMTIGDALKSVLEDSLALDGAAKEDGIIQTLESAEIVGLLRKAGVVMDEGGSMQVMFRADDEEARPLTLEQLAPGSAIDLLRDDRGKALISMRYDATEVVSRIAASLPADNRAGAYVVPTNLQLNSLSNHGDAVRDAADSNAAVQRSIMNEFNRLLSSNADDPLKRKVELTAMNDQNLAVALSFGDVYQMDRDIVTTIAGRVAAAGMVSRGMLTTGLRLTDMTDGRILNTDGSSDSFAAPMWTDNTLAHPKFDTTSGADDRELDAFLVRHAYVFTDAESKSVFGGLKIRQTMAKGNVKGPWVRYALAMNPNFVNAAEIGLPGNRKGTGANGNQSEAVSILWDRLTHLASIKDNVVAYQTYVKNFIAPLLINLDGTSLFVDRDGRPVDIDENTNLDDLFMLPISFDDLMMSDDKGNLVVDKAAFYFDASTIEGGQDDSVDLRGKKHIVIGGSLAYGERTPSHRPASGDLVRLSAPASVRLTEGEREMLSPDGKLVTINSTVAFQDIADEGYFLKGPVGTFLSGSDNDGDATSTLMLTFEEGTGIIRTVDREDKGTAHERAKRILAAMGNNRGNLTHHVLQEMAPEANRLAMLQHNAMRNASTKRVAEFSSPEIESGRIRYTYMMTETTMPVTAKAFSRSYTDARLNGKVHSEDLMSLANGAELAGAKLPTISHLFATPTGDERNDGNIRALLPAAYGNEDVPTARDLINVWEEHEVEIGDKPGFARRALNREAPPFSMRNYHNVIERSIEVDDAGEKGRGQMVNFGNIVNLLRTTGTFQLVRPGVATPTTEQFNVLMYHIDKIANMAFDVENEGTFSRFGLDGKALEFYLTGLLSRNWGDMEGKGGEAELEVYQDAWMLWLNSAEGQKKMAERYPFWKEDENPAWNQARATFQSARVIASLGHRTNKHAKSAEEVLQVTRDFNDMVVRLEEYNAGSKEKLPPHLQASLDILSTKLTEVRNAYAGSVETSPFVEHAFNQRVDTIKSLGLTSNEAIRQQLLGALKNMKTHSEVSRGYAHFLDTTAAYSMLQESGVWDMLIEAGVDTAGFIQIAEAAFLALRARGLSMSPTVEGEKGATIPSLQGNKFLSLLGRIYDNKVKKYTGFIGAERLDINTDVDGIRRDYQEVYTTPGVTVEVDYISGSPEQTKPVTFSFSPAQVLDMLFTYSVITAPTTNFSGKGGGFLFAFPAQKIREFTNRRTAALVDGRQPYGKIADQILYRTHGVVMEGGVVTRVSATPIIDEKAMRAGSVVGGRTRLAKDSSARSPVQGHGMLSVQSMPVEGGKIFPVSEVAPTRSFVDPYVAANLGALPDKKNISPFIPQNSEHLGGQASEIIPLFGESKASADFARNQRLAAQRSEQAALTAGHRVDGVPIAVVPMAVEKPIVRVKTTDFMRRYEEAKAEHARNSGMLQRISKEETIRYQQMASIVQQNFDVLREMNKTLFTAQQELDSLPKEVMAQYTILGGIDPVKEAGKHQAVRKAIEGLERRIDEWQQLLGLGDESQEDAEAFNQGVNAASTQGNERWSMLDESAVSDKNIVERIHEAIAHQQKNSIHKQKTYADPEEVSAMVRELRDGVAAQAEGWAQRTTELIGGYNPFKGTSNPHATERGNLEHKAMQEAFHAEDVTNTTADDNINNPAVSEHVGVVRNTVFGITPLNDHHFVSEFPIGAGGVKGVVDLAAVNKETGEITIYDFKPLRDGYSERSMASHRAQLETYKNILRYLGYKVADDSYLVGYNIEEGDAEARVVTTTLQSEREAALALVATTQIDADSVRDEQLHEQALRSLGVVTKEHMTALASKDLNTIETPFIPFQSNDGTYMDSAAIRKAFREVPPSQVASESAESMASTLYGLRIAREMLENLSAEYKGTDNIVGRYYEAIMSEPSLFGGFAPASNEADRRLWVQRMGMAMGRINLVYSGQYGAQVPLELQTKMDQLYWAKIVIGRAIASLNMFANEYGEAAAIQLLHGQEVVDHTSKFQPKEAVETFLPGVDPMTGIADYYSDTPIPRRLLSDSAYYDSMVLPTFRKLSMREIINSRGIENVSRRIVEEAVDFMVEFGVSDPEFILEKVMVESGLTRDEETGQIRSAAKGEGEQVPLYKRRGATQTIRGKLTKTKRQHELLSYYVGQALAAHMQKDDRLLIGADVDLSNWKGEGRANTLPTGKDILAIKPTDSDELLKKDPNAVISSLHVTVNRIHSALPFELREPAHRALAAALDEARSIITQEGGRDTDAGARSRLNQEFIRVLTERKWGQANYGTQEDGQRGTYARNCSFAVPVEEVTKAFFADEGLIQLLKDSGRDINDFNLDKMAFRMRKSFRDAHEALLNAAPYMMSSQDAQRLFHLRNPFPFYVGGGTFRAFSKEKGGELLTTTQEKVDQLNVSLTEVLKAGDVLLTRMRVRPDAMVRFFMDLAGVDTMENQTIASVWRGLQNGDYKNFGVPARGTVGDLGKTIYNMSLRRVHELAVRTDDATQNQFQTVDGVKIGALIETLRQAAVKYGWDVDMSGMTPSQIFAEHGYRPSNMGAADMLAKKATDIATGLQYKYAVNNALMQQDADGSPVVYALPGEIDDDAVVGEAMWETLARWWAEANGVVYDTTLSGRDNAIAIYREIEASGIATDDKRIRAVTFNKHTGQPEVMFRKMESGVRSLPSYMVKLGSPGDNRDGFFAQKQGGSNVAWMQHLIQTRRIEDQGMLLSALDWANTRMKSVALSLSAFHLVATGFESGIAAQGITKHLAPQKALRALANTAIGKQLGITEETFSTFTFLNALQTHDPIMRDIREMLRVMGITLSTPSSNPMDLDRTALRRDIRNLMKVAESKGYNVSDGSAKALDRFLFLMQDNMTDIVFGQVVNAVKITVAMNLITSLREEAMNQGRWFDPVRELRRWAPYVNAEVGGIDPAMYPWANPAAVRKLRSSMLSWQWTLGAWEAAGGGVLSQGLTGFALHPDVQARMGVRWFRMMAGVMYGLPALLQVAIHAAGKAAGTTDEDDKWWIWNNEPGKRTSFNLSPLLKMMAQAQPIRAAKGVPFLGLGIPAQVGDDPTFGFRKYYGHFGKQGWEIMRWFSNPLGNTYSKAALPLQRLFGALNGGDINSIYHEPFQGENVMSTLPQRLGYLLGGFVPLSISSMRQNRDAGFLSAIGPITKGGSATGIRKQMEKAMRAYSSPRALEGLYSDPRYWNDLPSQVAELMHAAEANGHDAKALLKDATSQLLSTHYRNAYNALPRKEGDKVKEAQLGRALAALHRLDFVYRNLVKSMESRDARHGKKINLTAEILTARERAVRDAFWYPHGRYDKRSALPGE